MGADKAFLRDSGGKLLLASLAERLAEWFGEVRLLADRPGKFGGCPELAAYPAEADRFPRLGPAGAILSALMARPGQAFFALAGDQPTLDLGVIRRLRDLFEGERADAALPRHGGAIEPLYAFYGPGCEASLARSLASGRRAIRASFPGLSVSYLDLSPEETPPGLFRNLNTPEEARALGYAPPGAGPGP
jgi:molybdopterin-guanine dinucleotide biosynthesis protein A